MAALVLSYTDAAILAAAPANVDKIDEAQLASLGYTQELRRTCVARVAKRRRLRVAHRRPSGADEIGLTHPLRSQHELLGRGWPSVGLYAAPRRRRVRWEDSHEVTTQLVFLFSCACTTVKQQHAHARVNTAAAARRTRRARRSNFSCSVSSRNSSVFSRKLTAACPTACSPSASRTAVRSSSCGVRVGRFTFIFTIDAHHAVTPRHRLRRLLHRVLLPHAVDVRECALLRVSPCI